MQIVFNGESVQLTTPCSLLELLERKLSDTHASLENNYQSFNVSDGDMIEMLSAVVGG